MPGHLPRRRSRPSATRSVQTSFSRRLCLEPLEERRLLAAGPTILSTTPSLTDGFLPVGTQQLGISFSAAVLGGDETSNYQLQGLGPDALLGTSDDVVLPLTVSYATDTATLSFAALPEGVYRLTVRDAITDAAGNKFDGDPDGPAGGDWVRDCVVDQSGGRLDPSFDGDGKVTTNLGVWSGARSVAIQPDGKIVVAGWRGFGNGFALARYLPDGSLDMSFGDGGKQFTYPGSPYGQTSSVAIQSDGRIVVAGYLSSGDSSDFALARYLSDGSLDTSFDGDGRLFTAFGGAINDGHSMAIQSDGRIVVAGSSGSGDSSDFALARYLSDGSLDTSFDGDGKLTTDLGGNFDIAYSMAIQSDGKIVVAGSSSETNDYDSADFALVRYLADGSLDTSFDSDGKLTTDIGSRSECAYSVAVQSDGKIVVAGYSSKGDMNYDFALACYLPDGSLDTNFDGDGKLTTGLSPSTDVGYSVALQSDGRILVAGYSTGHYIVSNYNFALVRYLPDGSLDMSFGDDGELYTDLGDRWDIAYSVAIQSDGRIVVAGGDARFALARYGAGSVHLRSNHGFRFDLDSDGWGAGQLTDAGGAADGVGRLQVEGIDYVSPASATLDDDGRTAVTGTQSVSGLEVHREVTVPNTGNEDFARTVDVFTNPTDAPITTTVRIVGNLGSDAATTVFATSDGDANVETGDQWIGTDDADGSGTPAAIHYIHGLTGVKPASVSIVGDNIEWTYNLTIPAGQTVRLAHFTIVGTTRAEAIAAAESLVGVKGFKGQAGAFLTQPEKDTLANFDFDRPTFAGVYDPKLARFYLRNSNTQGPADSSFLFGAPGWEAISGDWDGDGRDTIGAFQRDAAQFYLRNSNEGGNADVSFGFGAPGSNWVLLMGDWNGDGIDTVGSYDPAASQFYLRNSNSQGNADLAFGFGTPGANWTPVVGDWDGDGVDTIGLYDPQTGMFYLRNTFTTGMADVAFAYGVPNHGWQPLVGDWNGDGVETVGMFLPPASTFFLRNSNTVGNADVTFGLGYAGCQPIIGDWLGRDAAVQPTSLPDGQASGALQLAATDAVFSQLDEELSGQLNGLEPALS